MPTDRTDRVAIQLGRDTKTVGVRNCYLNYAISKLPWRLERHCHAIARQQKVMRAKRKLENSIRCCTEIEIYDERCMADMHLLR